MLDPIIADTFPERDTPNKRLFSLVDISGKIKRYKSPPNPSDRESKPFKQSALPSTPIPQPTHRKSAPPKIKSINLRIFLAGWAATFITCLPYCRFSSLLVDRLLQIVERGAS